jgi:hypothetical protein
MHLLTTPAILLAVLYFVSAFGFDQLFNFFDVGGAQLIERFEPAFGLRFRRQTSGVGVIASSTGAGGGGAVGTTETSPPPETVATGTGTGTVVVGTTSDVPPPLSTAAGCAAGSVSFDGTFPFLMSYPTTLLGIRKLIRCAWRQADAALQSPS